ncbi:hypothetical protein B0H10DRAFT_2235008 [Mycena sp. CBHHK59/15]|nr:hypothetical protein B0H10DRAFT_2235008 [Mycena sp. CBHHK59/15]
MATFDRSQWISQGKKWSDIPPQVKRVCSNAFDVPATIAAKILPGDDISLRALLDFTLPRSVLTIQGKAPDTSAFFSKHPPDMMDTSTILRLCYLDMPSISVVRRLVIDAKQAWPLFVTCRKLTKLSIRICSPENEEDLTYNDESDVPIEVLINHVTSGGVAPLPDGFVVGEDGDLARNGAAEDLELDVVADDLPLAVRRPKRATKAPTQYGGDEMWEEVSPVHRL